MANLDGHIRLPRAIRNSKLWTDERPSTCKLFLHLVMEAKSDDKPDPTGLTRGQVFKTWEDLAQDTQIRRLAVGIGLLRLRSLGIVTLQGGAESGSLITIKDYDGFRL